MRAGVMSFLVYFFVLLVAASSVLFGLDWMQAPLQPPSSERSIQAVVAPAATPVQAAGTAQPAVTAPVPSAPSPAVASNVGQAADAAKAEGNEPKPAPLCDVEACERAYRTFTVADCTYKPSYGPRRLCSKGNPPRRPAAVLASGEARAQVTCNVSACASAHQSFDASTCTYQTYAGMRRLCTR